MVIVVVAVVVWHVHRSGSTDTTAEHEKLEMVETPIAVDTPQALDHQPKTHKSWVDSHPVEYEERQTDLKVRKEDSSRYLQGVFPAPTPARQKAGQQLFAANCASCHGDSAMGDGAAGAYLDPPPANLTDPTNYHYGHDAKSIMLSTAYGNRGTGSVPWEGILSRDDMINVSLYVESIVKK